VGKAASFNALTPTIEGWPNRDGPGSRKLPTLLRSRCNDLICSEGPRGKDCYAHPVSWPANKFSSHFLKLPIGLSPVHFRKRPPTICRGGWRKFRLSFQERQRGRLAWRTRGPVAVYRWRTRPIKIMETTKLVLSQTAKPFFFFLSPVFFPGRTTVFLSESLPEMVFWALSKVT